MPFRSSPTGTPCPSDRQSFGRFSFFSQSRLIDMPETKAQRSTAPAIVRDRLGDKVTAIYAARRDPVSGQLVEEHPLLVVLAEVSDQEATELSGDLTVDVSDELGGHYVLVDVIPASEEQSLALPPEEVLPV